MFFEFSQGADRDGDAIYHYRCFLKTNKKLLVMRRFFFHFKITKQYLYCQSLFFVIFFLISCEYVFLPKVKIMPYYAIDVLRSMLRTRNLFRGCVIRTKMSCDNRNRIKTKIRYERKKNRLRLKMALKIQFQAYFEKFDIH